MEECPQECWYSQSCFSPPLCLHHKLQEPWKASYPFSRSKSLDDTFCSRAGEGRCWAVCWNPSQRRQPSLLAEVLRDETMSSGDFLQDSTALALPKHAACFHHTSLILRPFVFPFKHPQVKYCVFPTVWTSWTSKGGHSFCSALLSHFYCVQFPTSYPSPQRITFPCFNNLDHGQGWCVSPFCRYFLQKRQTEADRGAGLGAALKWGIRTHKKCF